VSTKTDDLINSFVITSWPANSYLVCSVPLWRAFQQHNPEGVMKTSRKSGYLAGRVQSVSHPADEGNFRSINESPGEAVASSCGDQSGRVARAARPFFLQCSDCEEILHDLANVVTGVLMNAQVLEWKLPPYSHLKRSVRELERNAQRGGELLKRLQRRLAKAGVQGHEAVEPEPAFAAKGYSPQRVDLEPAELTGDCEPCTSGFFPKRDDGREG
jgi:hypothetical protein